MLFYVSWYPGDPVYPAYDSDCSLLVSVSSVASYWTLPRLQHLPRRIIIDSGAYRYSATGIMPPAPRALFERQLQMVKGRNDIEVIICALDSPAFSRNLKSNEQDRRLHETIANAYELSVLTQQYGLPENVKTMAIVQGYDLPSLNYCARELKRIGFDFYGIGSLAFLHDQTKVVNRINSVAEIVGDRVHAFGVTGGRMLDSLFNLDVRSIDSSTPAKAAMYNQIFYSAPFRRYEIPSMRRQRRRSEHIEHLLPCECPVCRDSPNPSLLKSGKREYVYLRTLHNYFHLKQAIIALGKAEDHS